MQDLEVIKDWTKGKYKGKGWWWTRTFKNTKGCILHEHVLASTPEEATEKATAVKRWKEQKDVSNDRRIPRKGTSRRQNKAERNLPARSASKKTGGLIFNKPLSKHSL